MLTRMILVTGLVIAAASPSSAAIITYTTRAAMELAQPSDTFSLITFDGVTAQHYDTVAGLTTAAINFVGYTSPTPGPYDLVVAASIPSWGGGPALENNNPSSTGTIIVTLPANVFAVGVDLFDSSGTSFLGPNGNGYQISINNGSVSNFPTSAATLLPGTIFF
jgi:hypothetical protein